MYFLYQSPTHYRRAHPRHVYRLSIATRYTLTPVSLSFSKNSCHQTLTHPLAQQPLLPRENIINMYHNNRQRGRRTGGKSFEGNSEFNPENRNSKKDEKYLRVWRWVVGLKDAVEYVV